MFYLVRHTETEWNKQKRMQGWGDSPLTEEGRAVAHLLGETLKEKNITKIFTSDLGRCMETAKLINEHVNAKIIPSQDLREQNYGDMTGHPTEMRQQYARNPDLSPSEGESFHHMQKRVLHFIEKIDDHCLIVTHGDCSRIIIATALHKPFDDPHCRMKQNEIITIEKLAENKMKVVAREEA
jgi:broad specificity phosphatase PhoE